MIDRANFGETRADRDVHANKSGDYAAEYRSDVLNASDLLNSVARFRGRTIGSFEEVEVPVELRHHRYIRPMVSAINSPGTPIKNTVGNKYRRAFQYILNVAVSRADPDWRYFGRALLEHLKSELTAEFTIKSNMDHARRLFSMAAEASSDVKVKREIRALIGGKGAKDSKGDYWPNLRTVERKPTRSLEDIFGDSLDYTNEQYVNAVTDYASSFIRAWSDIRRRLRSDHPELHAKIHDAVTRIGVDNLKEIERKRTFSVRMQGVKDQWFELVSLNIEILVALDDPFLNMIAMSQWRNSIYFDQFAAAVNLPDRGAVGFAEQLLRRREPYPIHRWCAPRDGNIKILARLMLSILDFFGPSLEEETCFIWLLASRRVQLSNVGRLKRPQIDEDATGIWIRSYKGRNCKAENVCIKKNTKLGRALRAFLHDFDRQPFREANFDKLVTPFKTQTCKFKSTWNFHHLAFPDHAEALSAYRLSDTNLKIMKQIYSIVVDVERSINRANRYGDANKQTAKALLPSAVAQSHVYAEEAKRGGFTKSSTMQPTYDLENLDENSRRAKSEFHTLETREEIYRARSRDRIKLRKGRAFATAVSEEMANIASDIVSAWEERTSPLPVSALVDVVGLRGNAPEASPETILAAAKAENFLVEKSGLIRKDGMTYLFDSGLTARMMMEEIRHIEGELENLFSTQDVDKALNAWAKLSFLELLLKRFSSVSLKDAREKYGHLEGKIPHAPISEGGNSWIVK
ncbi:MULTISPECIES: hypothetical protein [unclassified Marinovum]|uniref:hypothetical protein n=1 Tax=unclassified Marinovum TaxID=2647166 RepID=UPI003EDC1BE1